MRLLLLGKRVVSAHRIERPFAARLDDTGQRVEQPDHWSPRCSFEADPATLRGAAKWSISTDSIRPIHESSGRSAMHLGGGKRAARQPGGRGQPLPVNGLGDPEDVTVGVSDVHLSDTPWLIGRRVGDF